MLRYNGDLKVNNINVVPYLTNISFEYNKIWGKDTGRTTLSGKWTGTLIGIFPKINCTFGPLTQAEIELLVPYLDAAVQSVTYYDPYKKALRTMNTYTGDYELEQTCLFSEVAQDGKPFDISFIAVEKRK